jgi:hypothetical protein
VELLGGMPILNPHSQHRQPEGERDDDGEHGPQRDPAEANPAMIVELTQLGDR